MYNGSTFAANNRTTEFTGVADEDDDDDDTHTTIIIIACICGGCLLLLFLIILLCGIGWWYRKKRHTKVWRVHVKPNGSTRDNTTSKHYEIRDIYWQVSQSHVEENEYVLGAGVVTDFNTTDEPVSENSVSENSSNEAVTLTKAQQPLKNNLAYNKPIRICVHIYTYYAIKLGIQTWLLLFIRVLYITITCTVADNVRAHAPYII